MTKRIFREGGPHKVKNMGNDQYQMSIPIPEDSEGRIARECPNDECSPAYFKVTPGTGIVDGQESIYCPYCKHNAEPDDFITQEQLRYAKEIAVQEAQKGIDDMVKDTLGLGSSGKKKLGGGLISIEMSYKTRNRSPVRWPFEDEVRRDVVCPHCCLNQTVFGLATWCSDCGNDIFLVHLAAEIEVIRSMLNDVERREQLLGRRVAAKDLENCLEDAVSIFEASAKALVLRALAERGMDQAGIDTAMKKIGNSFQNTDRAKSQLENLFGYKPNQYDIWEQLQHGFEKRHPVTHNLGVVDKKYLERAQLAEQEGREICISEVEIANLLDNVFSAVSDIHQELFAPQP